jgi:nicotinate-nucleotide adenylyltransferase
VSEPIALFGTSADPPTLGHEALLRHLLLHYPQVATWASDNPLKQHDAPLAQRAQMLGALVASVADPHLRHVQTLSSPWALTTLERAAALWPGAPLVFVVGSDLVPQIPRWRGAAQVLQRCRLAVVPRAGWPLTPSSTATLEALGGQLSVLPLPIPATASSQLRQQINRQQIPAAVWPLVCEHNLYGLGAAAP